MGASGEKAVLESLQQESVTRESETGDFTAVCGVHSSNPSAWEAELYSHRGFPASKCVPLYIAFVQEPLTVC